MASPEDVQTEAKLREALFNGDVQSARELLRVIDSETLRDELKQVVREYEGYA